MTRDCRACGGTGRVDEGTQRCPYCRGEGHVHPYDPRTTCPGCGAPALDGKVTCGDVACGSTTGQDR